MYLLLMVIMAQLVQSSPEAEEVAVEAISQVVTHLHNNLLVLVQEAQEVEVLVQEIIHQMEQQELLILVVVAVVETKAHQVLRQLLEAVVMVDQDL